MGLFPVFKVLMFLPSSHVLPLVSLTTKTLRTRQEMEPEMRHRQATCCLPSPLLSIPFPGLYWPYRSGSYPNPRSHYPSILPPFLWLRKWHPPCEGAIMLSSLPLPILSPGSLPAFSHGIQVAPAWYCRGPNPRWESVSNGKMKDICKDAKDRGRNLPYFNNLLNYVFVAHVMVPHDSRHFMHILLSPTEFILWEEVWKKQLQQLKDYAQEDRQAHLTLDHLAREGDFTKPGHRPPLSCVRRCSKTSTFTDPRWDKTKYWLY